MTGGSAYGQTRSSALWGSGNGGGEKRSPRATFARLAIAPLLLVAAVTPLGASAHRQPAGSVSWVAPSLQRAAEQDPQASLHVIVRSEDGLAAARKATQEIGTDARKLPIADAVSADVSGSDLSSLEATPGLTVTPDAAVSLDSSSKQLWPYAVGVDRLWRSLTQGEHAGHDATVPTIAIVDSGIDAGREDFSKTRKRSPELSMNRRSATSTTTRLRRSVIPRSASPCATVAE